MTIRHLLRDFSGEGSTLAGLSEDSADPPEAELRGFEDGYKAGWDDAVEASSLDATRIGADLARNLQDLSFTYQEAHGAMLRALKPLLTQIASSVLPEFAKQSLAPLIAENLTLIAADAGEVPVTITMHPDDRARISGIKGQDLGFPVIYQDSVDLVEGQVMMRFGDRESEINLPEALRDVTTAIDGFYRELNEETQDD